MNERVHHTYQAPRSWFAIIVQLITSVLLLIFVLLWLWAR
jgi:uncharacterized integral membrane protein